MKKGLATFFISSLWTCVASPHGLIDSYEQALSNDPIFQQAVSEQLAAKQGVPISFSSLLPAISATANPSVTRSGYSGANLAPAGGGSALSPRNNTQRAYTLEVALTQTVFDLAQFAALSGAFATAKSADATLNAALQNLIVRTANAYLAIAKDEDIIYASRASMLAYSHQLDLVRQQNKAGTRSLTDVYTAQTSYNAANATYLTAKMRLASDKESLRAITGHYVARVETVSSRFPLTIPQPTDIEAWAKAAIAQNWSIKAAQYTVQGARQMVKQQFAGHFPTVTLETSLDRQYSYNINGYNSFNDRNGPGTQTDRSIMINMTLPIFSGGGVTAQTKQATYDYENSQHQLEQVVSTANMVTRQSYLNLSQGIAQINIDLQTIQSSKQSVSLMGKSYLMGTSSIVDLLNQQQKQFQAEIQYANDRYAFLNNFILLKQAVGTLNIDDLRAIDSWLI